MTRVAGPAGAVGRTVRAPKTAALIADQLRQQIVRGSLQPGDRLPPETDLMEQFGVSRPTLREAFRILEHESLVEVRRGARGGLKVLPPDVGAVARSVGALMQMSHTTMADLFEARMAIEPCAVAMLAIRRSDEDIADMRQIVDDLAAQVGAATDGRDKNVWALAVYRFHDLIFERCGNQTFGIIGGVLRETVAPDRSTDLLSISNFDELIAQFDWAIKGFRRLLTMVEEGNAVGAEQFWREHMRVGAQSMMWGKLATHEVIDIFS